MAQSVELGSLDEVVDRLVKNGRFNSKNEVLREGVRLVEERENRQTPRESERKCGIEVDVSSCGRSPDDVFLSASARYNKILRSQKE